MGTVTNLCTAAIAVLVAASTWVGSPVSTVPVVEQFDVIVVGDSIAGAGVVQGLIENSDLTIGWITETGYVGGQASAAGVSAMDDADGAGIQSRTVYPNSALVNTYRNSPHGPDPEYGNPMWHGHRNLGQAWGPNPLEVKTFLTNATTHPNVTIITGFTPTAIHTRRGTITSITNGQRILTTTQLVDATEFQDLYPLIPNLNWTIPNCIQDTTWVAVRHEDSTLYPAFRDIDRVRTVYGDEWVDEILTHYRSKITVDGLDEWQGWDGLEPPFTPSFEWGYREVSGGYSSLNWFNDHPMTPLAVTDPATREATLAAAKTRTFVLLWYLRWELGETTHGLATDLGYQHVPQTVNAAAIPDNIERFFPPAPYIRQARTLTDPVMTWQDIHTRARAPQQIEALPEGFMQWGYMSDSHGCTDPDQSSPHGLFSVPSDVFIPSDVEGFWPGMLRGARVDAVVASTLRMQPSEYIGGYHVAELIIGATR